MDRCMNINSYDQLNSFQIGVLKEIGSIGAGNAATALAQTLVKEVMITVPEVKILDYNSAIRFIGAPELLVAGELVRLSGDISGTMLYMQKLEFINVILQTVLGRTVTSFDQLDEMDISAVTEIGNIIISSYVNAIASLTGIDIDLSVPSVAVDMIGAIASIPMIEYGYESNSIMIIDVDFICEGNTMPSNLILVPDVASLGYLLDKLGINYDQA